MLMIWFLLILVFTVQAEVTGVINVGEPDAATPAATETPIIMPAATETSLADNTDSKEEVDFGFILFFAAVALVLLVTLWKR